MASAELAAILRAKNEAKAELDSFAHDLKTTEQQAESFGQSLRRIGEIAGGIGLERVLQEGVSEAFRGIGHAVLGMNADLETATLQFKVLTGDADAAAEHVRMLFDFAKATPFETAPIIEASRLMHTLGGAAFDTAANLKIIGDAAAGASAPIQEVAMWVSRAYSNIQAGRPFGEAAMRLQELGLLSGDARAEIERLSDVGADSATIWRLLQGELGKFSGAMRELQGTWAGLTSTAADSVNLLVSGALKPLFEDAKNGLMELNKQLDDPRVQTWANETRDALVESRQAWIDVRGEWQRAGSDLDPLAATLGSLANAIRFVNEQTAELAHNASAPLRLAHSLSADLQGAIFQGFTGMNLADLIASEDAKRQFQQVRDDWRTEGRRMAAAVGEGIEDAAATVALGDRLRFAFGIEDAAKELGDGGDELVRAVTAAIKDSTDHNINEVSQAAEKIMKTWLKEFSTEDAEARGAALRAALMAGLEAGDTVGAEGILSQAAADIAANHAAEERRKAADKAKQEADRITREAEAAVREAERLAREFHATKPITADLFEGAFVREDVRLGPGREAFEALRRVIEQGGQANIDAVGRMAAGMRERMTAELGPEQGAEWFGSFMDAVNVAIATQSVDAARNVGELVKNFDIERQLQAASTLRAEAINRATDEAIRAIDQINQRFDEQRDKAEADFAEARRIAAERERLQAEITAGLNEAREIQRGTNLGTTQTREFEDIDLRRAREDEDRRNRAAAQSRTNAQAELRDQDAINAARFKGNSLEILAALKAADQRKQAIKDQAADEEAATALRRQREDEDYLRRTVRQAEDIIRARAQAAELEEIRKQLTAPLEEFNRKLAEDTLATKIREYEEARIAAIGAANQRLSDTTDVENQRFNAAAEKAGSGVRIEEINLYNTNYGLQGDEDILNGIQDELVQRVLSRLAAAGT